MALKSLFVGNKKTAQWQMPKINALIPIFAP